MVNQLVRRIVPAAGASLAVLVASAVGVRRCNTRRYPGPSSAPGFVVDDPSTYPTSVSGASVERIAAGDVVGFHFVPDHDIRHGTVVVFGGSEGSPDFARAAELAARGFESFAMFFFGPAPLPARLDRVPLDLWPRIRDEVVRRRRGEGPITVMSGSKGAEFVLAAASRFDTMDHVVLFAPAAHHWSALSQGSEHSSWTLDGAEVPYVRSRSARPAMVATLLGYLGSRALARPAAMAHFYIRAIAASPAAEQERARIRVEDFSGDLLVFAGGDDRMWPSADNACLIKQARPARTEVHVHPDAGHVFEGPGWVGPFLLGGTERANTAAGLEVERVLAEHLAMWHPAA